MLNPRSNSKKQSFGKKYFKLMYITGMLYTGVYIFIRVRDGIFSTITLVMQWTLLYDLNVWLCMIWPAGDGCRHWERHCGAMDARAQWAGILLQEFQRRGEASGIPGPDSKVPNQAKDFPAKRTQGETYYNTLPGPLTVVGIWSTNRHILHKQKYVDTPSN